MKHAADPFERLYNENCQRVCQLLTRIVGPQEAEDLAQIVFAKAARALPGFRGDAQASTWLYQIAAHLSKVSRLPQHFDAFPGLNPPNRP